MKTQRKLLTAAALAAALTLSGCWGDNEDDLPPVATTEVPDSAGTGTAAGGEEPGQLDLWLATAWRQRGGRSADSSFEFGTQRFGDRT